MIILQLIYYLGYHYFFLVDCFSSDSVVKNAPAMQETWIRLLGWEDPLEKEMASDSSILAWRIPWTEEPGELQSMGSQKSQTRLSDQRTTKISNCLESVLWDSGKPRRLGHFLQARDGEHTGSALRKVPVPQGSERPHPLVPSTMALPKKEAVDSLSPLVTSTDSREQSFLWEEVGRACCHCA